MTTGPPTSASTCPIPVTGAGAPRCSALLTLRSEVAKVVVGQDAAVSGLVVALLCQRARAARRRPRGGQDAARTDAVRTLQLESKRVQFTPDLMPSDITGSLVYDSA